jgi:chromosome partitioning protein
MGRGIAIVCPKGGVGKTTVSVNLASALADKGFRCLVIGVDPQCGLISSFGRDRFDVDCGLLDLFDPEGQPDGAIQASGVDNLDFISSNVWSREEEQQLVQGAADFPERIGELVRREGENYDFIFMDCPPNLGPLTSSALQAAESFLVPMQAEELAYRALPRLFDGLDEMGGQGRHVPELMGIVLNQVDPRTRLAAEVTGRVREEFEDDVFETVIPRTVRLAEVALRGRPVNRFNRTGAASRAFEALADEILAPLIASADAAVETVVDAVEPDREPVAVAVAADVALEDKPLPVGAVEGLISQLRTASAGDAGKYTNDLMDGERVVSLDEIEEPAPQGCSGSRPNLDDYEGTGEDEPLH